MRCTHTGQALMKYPICDVAYPVLPEVIAEIRRADVIFTNLEVPFLSSHHFDMKLNNGDLPASRTCFRVARNLVYFGNLCPSVRSLTTRGEK